MSEPDITEPAPVPVPVVIEPEAAGQPHIVYLVPPPFHRRVLEGSILFFTLIVFLRAFAIEPFGVPTGSMAGAMLGNHREVECPRCGHIVCVGEPSVPIDDESSRKAHELVPCPNCGMTHLPFDDAILIPGDRLLVDKNIYHFRSPRRWEIAVFRTPNDPVKPYVKRVIGLPGESVQIRQGDIAINGELLRKTFAQTQELMMLQFDHNCAPQDHGWKSRWVIDSRLDEVSPSRSIDASDPLAQVHAIFQGSELHLAATNSSTHRQTLTYRNWNLNLAHEEAILDQFSYNLAPRGNAAPRYGLTDFIVSCEIEIVAGSGNFWCQLTDGTDLVRAEFSEAGAQLVQEQSTILRQASDFRLQPGKRYPLCLAFVDRRVTLTIDGHAPFPSYDLPALPARAEVSRPFRFGVRGTQAIVRDIKLYRDVYYLPKGINAVQEPYTLKHDEYFMMGDNSANSDDSRFWKIPGVPEAAFLGKPFLLHQPSHRSEWSWWGTPRQSIALDWNRVHWLR